MDNFHRKSEVSFRGASKPAENKDELVTRLRKKRKQKLGRYRPYSSWKTPQPTSSGSSTGNQCGTSKSTVDTLSWLFDNPKEQQASTSRSSTICINNLQGQCPFGSVCPQYHSGKKYQWQRFDTVRNRWLDLGPEENDRIEKAFSDPSNSDCHFADLALRVNFDRMEMKRQCQPESPYNIRRLSTSSSCELNEECNSVQATRWIWYWHGPFDQWIEFGSSQGSFECTVESPTIEAEFLQNPDGGLCFKRSENEYRIDFKTMTQKNLDPRYGTERKVRRRPVNGSAKNIESAASNFMDLNSTESTCSWITEINDASPTICTDYLQEECRNGMSCPRYHCREKYQWQKYDITNKQWLDFVPKENNQIEEAFCDPYQDYCNIIALGSEVSFDRMEMKERNSSTLCQIRRLSTLSSVDQSRRFCDEYSTRWIWYWQGPNNKWNSFDTQQGSPQVSVTTAAIETQFLQTPRSKLFFHTRDHKYTLDFKTMVQKNLDPRYGTERKVKRRPAHSSLAKSSSKLQISPTPKYWEQTNTEQTGYQLIELTKGSDEYLHVAGSFYQTMDTFRIKSIERVQNVELWDRYCRQKMWMKEKLRHSNTVNERKLFHGTKDEHIHAICQQGFDPRVSGSSSGTTYGQGSYFARDATYSRNYSTGNQMFFCKVLVGEFTTGDPNFKRPPEKPSLPSELYDSCVDDTADPSIFVVFTREQAYPGWLVKYSPKT